MVDQATMNASPTTDGFPAARLGRGMAALAHDATAIAELQVKLAALDLKESSRFLRQGAILAAISGALLLASLPLGMFGLAALLTWLTGWELWISQLVTAGVGLAVCGLLFWLCWRTVRQVSGTLERSRHELARNVAWLKGALRPHEGVTRQ
jgi:uncharacterized membrane protein YqjE